MDVIILRGGLSIKLTCLERTVVDILDLDRPALGGGWEEIWRSLTNVKVLDIHELAAGKLNALLEREVSRDLFDSHQLLTQWPFDVEKLRIAFTVYAGMRKQSWAQISIEHVKFSVKDIRDKLIPVLKSSEALDMRFPATQAWATKLLGESKAALSAVLPFRQNEIEFLQQLQSHGNIRADLLRDDRDFCGRVNQHPLLHWCKQQLLK